MHSLYTTNDTTPPEPPSTPLDRVRDVDDFRSHASTDGNRDDINAKSAAEERTVSGHVRVRSTHEVLLLRPSDRLLGISECG